MRKPMRKSSAAASQEDFTHFEHEVRHRATLAKWSFLWPEMQLANYALTPRASRNVWLEYMQWTQRTILRLMMHNTAAVPSSTAR